MVDMVEKNLVLDVGCGDRPRGTVNVDVYRETSVDLYEREVVDVKALNFVQATIYHLPFRSNIFKKVLCYHLLEHLRFPSKAVTELMRVANGTVEIIVPSKYHELIQNFFLPKRKQWAKNHHLWHFDKTQLTKLFARMNLHPKIQYRYKFATVLQNVQVFHVQSFRQLILYGFLEAVLPPTPGELKVTINKKVKPIARAR
jgi:predicted SAM-dependent methyltransferase